MPSDALPSGAESSHSHVFLRHVGQFAMVSARRSWIAMYASQGSAFPSRTESCNQWGVTIAFDAYQTTKCMSTDGIFSIEILTATSQDTCRSSRLRMVIAVTMTSASSAWVQRLSQFRSAKAKSSDTAVLLSLACTICSLTSGRTLADELTLERFEGVSAGLWDREE